MKSLTITRENYKDFCEETNLTKAEWQQVFAMRRQIRDGDYELRMFVEAQAGAEQEAHRLTERWKSNDWADMVQWSDTLVRLQRAQIAAYEEWQERSE